MDTLPGILANYHRTDGRNRRGEIATWRGRRLENVLVERTPRRDPEGVGKFCSRLVPPYEERLYEAVRKACT